MRYYNVAGIIIKYEANTNKCFDELMKDYESMESDDHYDVFIKCSICDNIEIPKGEYIGNVNKRTWIKTADGYASFDYNENLNKCLASVVIDGEWKNIDVKLYDIRKNLGLEDRYHQFNMMGELFRFIVLKHNGVVIHSSSISYNENGIIFSAPSETGKSTHTSLWKKCYPETEIINDDSPAIMVRDDNIFLCGAPWSGTSGVNTNKAIPLKAIVFIRRGEKNTIEKINSKQAIEFLINEIRTPLVSDIMEITLDIVGNIISRVPTYILHCTISDEAVYVVKNALNL